MGTDEILSFLRGFYLDVIRIELITIYMCWHSHLLLLIDIYPMILTLVRFKLCLLRLVRKLCRSHTASAPTPHLWYDYDLHYRRSGISNKAHAIHYILCPHYSAYTSNWKKCLALQNSMPIPLVLTLTSHSYQLPLKYRLQTRKVVPRFGFTILRFLNKKYISWFCIVPFCESHSILEYCYYFYYYTYFM